MRIAIPTETSAGEQRIAATPDTVHRLVAAGYDVVVQAGAGARAHVTDGAFRMAGASVAQSVRAQTVDILLHVGSPHPGIPSRMPRGSYTVGVVEPFDHPATVAALAESETTSFAVDLLPDGFHASGMDVAADVALVTGHRLFASGAFHFDGSLGPVVTPTAALAAAHVLVVGGGVAGLAAADLFAHARARVTLCDPDEDLGRQVGALGAAFVHLPDAREPADAGAQADQLAPYVADADIVVAVPASPGHHVGALSHGMVGGMRPGSLVLDGGGRHKLSAHSTPGEVLDVPLATGGSVRVVHLDHAAADMSRTSSELYARSVCAFILKHTHEGQFIPDPDDPVASAICLTDGGYVVHRDVAAAFPRLTTPRQGSSRPQHIDVSDPFPAAGAHGEQKVSAG